MQGKFYVMLQPKPTDNARAQGAREILARKASWFLSQPTMVAKVWEAGPFDRREDSGRIGVAVLQHHLKIGEGVCRASLPWRASSLSTPNRRQRAGFSRPRRRFDAARVGRHVAGWAAPTCGSIRIWGSFLEYSSYWQCWDLMLWEMQFTLFWTRAC